MAADEAVVSHHPRRHLAFQCYQRSSVINMSLLPSVSPSRLDSWDALSRPDAPTAVSLAALSSTLLPLMRAHNIRANFSSIRDGMVEVDATQNPTRAYKVRGALASINSAKHQGNKSVWTASAGNHGAGVAMAARLLGLDATVYVPETAPKIKVQNIETFGARVIKTGANFDECLAAALACQERASTSSAFIHPFDDHIVAAGQGTLGLELVEHLNTTLRQRSFQAVRLFVPIGGGGLISGMASTLRTLWNELLPPLQIIGVVDESSPASLIGTLFGRPVAARPDTIADGTRVAQVGQTFLSLAPLIDFIMPVPHDAIVATMRQHFQQNNEALEPSGALALTGEALARRHSLLPHTKASLHYAVVSGRNVDDETFRTVMSEPARRCERSQSRVPYQVRIPEKDGELLRFLNTVAEFNIASLTYKQRAANPLGDLQVEFDVENSKISELHDQLLRGFPGTNLLSDSRSRLFQVGAPVAQHYQDQLIALDDHPGSFRDYVQGLHDSGTLGSVGFLFYRQPAKPGSRAQVVIGRAASSPRSDFAS
jgi:threonine dehydratase